MYQEIEKRGLEGYLDFGDPSINLDGITRGSVNCLIEATGLRVAKGPGSSAGRGDINAFVAGDVVAGCTNDRANVAAYRETTYLLAGETGATAYIEGVGTFTIQSYTTIILGGSQYPLAIPVPVLTARDDDIPGQISGGVTFRMTFYRSATKGESNASEATANIVLDSEAAVLEIPARPNGSIDKFRIYASKHGEGPLQINYYLGEYTYGTDVPTGGGDLEIDYEDSDLNIFVQAPYVLNAAPDSQFIAVMGAHSLAVGCEPKGSFGLWASIFQRLESYNANAYVVMNPMEPFTCVHGGGTMQDGLLLLGQADAISAAVLTGSPTVPVLPRNLFMGVGVASGAQLDAVFGVIIALTGQKGLIRSGAGDKPETEWTEKIKHFLEGFDSTQAVLRYDPHTDMVILAGNNSIYGGNCAIGYYWGRPGDTWTSPIALSFTPASGFVKDGRLYLTNGTNRFLWEGGSNTGATANYQSTDGGARFKRKTVERFAAYSDSSSVNVVLTEGPDGTTVQTHNSLPISSGWTGVYNTLVGKVQAFSAKVTWTGAGKMLRGVVMKFLVHRDE